RTDNLMTIHQASIDDVSRIVKLINAAFRIEAFFVDGDRIDAEKVRSLFNSGKFLLAYEDGNLVGCIYVEPRGESGYLGLLSVEPLSQRSGIGRRLVDAGEQYFRESGCREAELQTVNVREELGPYYRKLGYIESGTAPFPAEVKTKVPCHFV